MLPLATERAGGIAWEYMFHFDGGAPPWTSGLSQGTALQVLARAWSRFKEPAYLTAAQQALGIFETPPPAGRARRRRRAGARVRRVHLRPERQDPQRVHPGDRRAVRLHVDHQRPARAERCSKKATREARAQTPSYDTGAWSMYDQYGESDLNYHELLTEFLQHLCERTRKGQPTLP